MTLLFHTTTVPNEYMLVMDPADASSQPADEASALSIDAADGWCNCFTGMRADLARRWPQYWGDWRDGLSLKVLSSTLFMVSTSLAPAITFSAVLEQSTRINVAANSSANQSCEDFEAGYGTSAPGEAVGFDIRAGDGPQCVAQLGPVEVIFSTALTGAIFAIFGGQPLVIVGVTGPVTIFTLFVFEIADALSISFLPFYAWVQFWAALMHVLLAASNACKYVSLVTRFSCETFGLLIALIYLYAPAGRPLHILAAGPHLFHSLPQNRTSSSGAS